MEGFKLALTLAIPAIGAAFVWLLNVARKDPPLFYEIDRILDRWTKEMIAGTLFLGVVVGFITDPSEEGLAVLALLVFVILYALFRLRRSLPFFRRVAQLGPAHDTQTTTLR
jgi:hypothetical protein